MISKNGIPLAKSLLICYRFDCDIPLEYVPGSSQYFAMRIKCPAQGMPLIGSLKRSVLD